MEHLRTIKKVYMRDGYDGPFGVATVLDVPGDWQTGRQATWRDVHICCGSNDWYIANELDGDPLELDEYDSILLGAYVRLLMFEHDINDSNTNTWEGEISF